MHSDRLRTLEAVAAFASDSGLLAVAGFARTDLVFAGTSCLAGEQLQLAVVVAVKPRAVASALASALDFVADFEPGLLAVGPYPSDTDLPQNHYFHPAAKRKIPMYCPTHQLYLL